VWGGLGVGGGGGGGGGARASPLDSPLYSSFILNYVIDWPFNNYLFMDCCRRSVFKRFAVGVSIDGWKGKV